MKHDRVECMEIYLKSSIYSSGVLETGSSSVLDYWRKETCHFFCFSSPVTVPAFKHRSFLSRCSVSGGFLDLCAFWPCLFFSFSLVHLSSALLLRLTTCVANPFFLFFFFFPPSEGCLSVMLSICPACGSLLALQRSGGADALKGGEAGTILLK